MTAKKGKERKLIYSVMNYSSFCVTNKIKNSFINFSVEYHVCPPLTTLIFVTPKLENSEHEVKQTTLAKMHSSFNMHNEFGIVCVCYSLADDFAWKIFTITLSE